MISLSQRKRSTASRLRQRGAVAIVFGLSIAVLLAMGGLVIDLGHLYIVKTELQNAADAAALAGAKDLNQAPDGITKAVAKATAVSAKNQYNFSTSVVLDGSDASTAIQFGASPGGPWLSPGAAFAAPQGLSFVRVQTGTKTLPTYLMKVVNIADISTFGTAVAGRYVNDVTPLGVCAVDPVVKAAKYTYPPPLGTGITELVEFGFRRGVTYNLFGLNPLGGTSDPYLINPVDTTAGGCTAAHSSSSFTAPFLCGGNSTVLSNGIGQIYTNTGLSASEAASLNSRFDDFSSPSVCNAATAPPDTNIKEYNCIGTSDAACLSNPSNSVAVTPPINWMEPGANNLPDRGSIALQTGTSKPDYLLPSVSPVPATSLFSKYGPLWAYGPPIKATSTTPPAGGSFITPTEANANPMYSLLASPYFDTSSATNYPTSNGAGFPVSTAPSPYTQTAGPYFKAPSHPGKVNRRILNLVLVDCRTAPVGPASCGAMNAVGIGKFFMTVKADFTGGASNKRLDAEFAGLISPVPTSEIKLYAEQ